jgi:osmoprotectant transport system substrate-binding protein
MLIDSVPVKRGVLAGAAAIAALCLAACGSSPSSTSPPVSSSGSSSDSPSNPLAGGAPKGTVVVGSANFPEDELLAQIYLEALQGAGVKVTPKFNIGAREVYYPEIEKGAITVIPEYNGALLTTSVDTTSKAATTPEVDSALTAKLPSSLEILNPSSAQDKDSVTVTQAFAKQHHLTSIAQLKPIAKTMIFGAPPEFKTRADGLIGLRKNYGLTFKGFDPLDESGPITLAALQSGKAQAADVFTTTPQIITDHLVPLADPKFNFAAQNVIPLVYKPGVNATIIKVLNEISVKLTTAGLLGLDKAVVLDKDPYAAVAAGWLKAVGIKS